MGDTPLWLKCPTCNSSLARFNGTAAGASRGLVATGRRKPNPRRSGSARVSKWRHEVRHSCGRTFWTTHRDAERLFAALGSGAP